MLAHRIETTIQIDGTLTLENLPFHSGEPVEVIILAKPRQNSQQNQYSLWGTALHYIDPTQPVALDDWEAES